ncbi:peroxiredoxin [Tardiphaga sp. vice352]|uniref:peroxiredoxin n=1 Tax=unclassified Tardiphaga TaxID=2631404 RepID=UPI0011656A20|nr:MULTISPECIES: peroxiredoxin [unclassified Tardiphaga]QDM17120.1 peroxiredoxin [Tardiphaga sp. vice278]QDM22099.1 peroxiredoxin [Tardiphaga sp. vice154]QDM32480.1 peroxiredoxin [Tardiphaga sp. vice352]
MSKKSRENSSKASTESAAKSAARPAAKSAAKPAAKKVAKPVVAKPVAKARAKKTVAQPVKPAATAVAKVAAKAKPAAKAPKAVAAAKARKPAPAAKAVAAPKPAKAKLDQAPALAAEGSLAPGFSLPRDGGATVSLADFAGQKLVIFFYPRANTPGCTKEAIDFTRLGRDFKAADTMVLGVSADPLKAQESFRDKHDLTTPLLSDETQSMLKAYGAWGEKSMYGKVFEGVLRTTVLIGSDGRVARIWRGVKVDGHADAVLEQARQI